MLSKTIWWRRLLVVPALFATLLVVPASSAFAQGDSPPPIQAAERSLQIVAPDGTRTNCACITTRMHPGQGQAGPGYDNVTYPIFVALQVQPGNGDGSQANANMEGMACRPMYQGFEVFDVLTGKPFPPLP
jgi:hypothetical protein